MLYILESYIQSLFSLISIMLLLLFCYVNIFIIILQGLRTLELCVDNLQPDFLYDHIQPVRAELMQVCHVSLICYL